MIIANIILIVTALTHLLMAENLYQKILFSVMLLLSILGVIANVYRF